MSTSIKQNENRNKAEDFEKYVLGEIEFYKNYFREDVYQTLDVWNREGDQRWKFKTEEFNRETIWPGSLKKGAFQPLIDILESHEEKFKKDLEGLKRQIEQTGELYHVDDDCALRLALWSSAYANDEHGVLSPFGPYCFRYAREMRHHKIGILDALEQLLWEPPKKDPDETINAKKQKHYADENIWKADLIRAQLLLFMAYGALQDFLEKGGKTNDLESKILDHLMAIAIDKNDIEEQINSFSDHNYLDKPETQAKLRSLKFRKGRLDALFKSIKESVTDLKKPEQKELIEKLFELFESKTKHLLESEVGLEETGKSDEEQEQLSQLVESKTNHLHAPEDDHMETGKSLEAQKQMLQFLEGLSKPKLKKLFKATFLKPGLKYSPLVQLVHSNASAWAADKQVPTIIVINKTKATTLPDGKSEKSRRTARQKRLQAYAALPHEFGHDIADSFANDALIADYKKAIEEHKSIKHKELWKAWIAELFADLTGIALLGRPSLEGLIEALKELRIPVDLIQKDEESEEYDSHPVPIIRISAAFYFHKEIYGSDASGIELETKWKKDMKENSQFIDQLQNKRISREELENEREYIYEILGQECPCLKKQSILTLFEKIRKHNHYESLTAHFHSEMG